MYPRKRNSVKRTHCCNSTRDLEQLETLVCKNSESRDWEKHDLIYYQGIYQNRFLLLNTWLPFPHPSLNYRIFSPLGNEILLALTSSQVRTEGSLEMKADHSSQEVVGSCSGLLRSLGGH